MALLGLDLVTVVAIILVAGGVVGSLVPLAPGALLSLAGVYLYWWHTGYTDPSLFVLVALTLVGVVTVLVDWLGGMLSASVSGASTATTVVAGIAGLVLMLLTGPVGILVGVAGTVFALEYYGNDDAEASARTAVYTTVGMLASNVVQALLTFGILIGFLLAVFF
jgi:hypothetical protein